VVVVTSTNRGYSWNLETHQVYQFQIPNPGNSYNRIHGSGNLVAIALRDSVVVHDVQAEREIPIQRTGKNTRISEGVEDSFGCNASVIANAEERVIWLLRSFRLRRPQDPNQYSCAIDGLRLETGEIIPGEVRSFSPRQPLCEDGLWQFWDTTGTSSRWHPGPAQRTENVQVRRTVFDVRTGAWAEEAYTIMFPGWITGSSCKLVWMLDQEPGSRLIRARVLAPAALAGHAVGGSFPFHCLGLCDKFLLGETVKGTIVIRFKGIHDLVGQPPPGPYSP